MDFLGKLNIVGPSSLGGAVSLRYTSRTAAGSTAATDAWVVFTGTAAVAETIPQATAPANNSSRWVRYVNKSSYTWTLTGVASTNTINGGTSFDVAAGCTADILATSATTWIVTAYFATGTSGVYQPQNANLTAISALSTTSFGLSLLTQADAAAARSTLGAAAASHSHSYLALTGGSLTGGINLSTDNSGIQGTMGGGSDYWRITGTGASDNGVFEIATTDNGNEGIAVRQYTGVAGFTTVSREAWILDSYGNTSFPQIVKSPVFASSAAKFIGDSDGRWSLMHSEGSNPGLWLRDSTGNAVAHLAKYLNSINLQAIGYPLFIYSDAQVDISQATSSAKALQIGGGPKLWKSSNGWLNTDANFGVQAIEAGGSIYSRSNIYCLNAASDNWNAFATRNTGTGLMDVNASVGTFSTLNANNLTMGSASITSDNFNIRSIRSFCETLTINSTTTLAAGNGPDLMLEPGVASNFFFNGSNRGIAMSTAGGTAYLLARGYGSITWTDMHGTARTLTLCNSYFTLQVTELGGTGKLHVIISQS